MIVDHELGLIEIRPSKSSRQFWLKHLYSFCTKLQRCPNKLKKYDIAYKLYAESLRPCGPLSNKTDRKPQYFVDKLSKWGYNTIIISILKRWRR